MYGVQVVALSAEEAAASVEQEKGYAERQEQIDGTWFAEITEDGCPPLEMSVTRPPPRAH